ncbi:MAG: tetratricopeptide repeat protein [Phormidium tanganyikae FI6-MK23]|jgi:tetratricopeptide (TPR) repeat protein|nr:tetratricopeptide repeat protein [Phormidium tanganyikae FI6-MK23]
MPNFDDITKLLAILGTITGGIVGTNKLLEARRKAKRIRQLPAGDFPFDVIKPRSPDLLKQIMGGDEKNPLADYKIPYQERHPDLSIRRELEIAFTEKNWVLILGKSGLGKTREAAHLADVLNQEGWTVLKLADQAGEWLDVPKEFPSEVRPDDKLLFFLDDLNRWMYAGNPHEIHPKAGEELARPLREPVQERLPRLLQYFERQGKSSYVRVIATARDEREPDKPRETSPWDKLQWEKYKSFWQQFQCYSLVEPSEEAIVSLLTDCVAAVGLRGVPEEYGLIARQNDGTFENITLNLESALSRDLDVNIQEFSPKLDETWRQKYNQVVGHYPLAVYVYDAVELLRTLNLPLTAPLLSATAKHLLPRRGVRRLWHEWQLRTVMRYLMTTEQILKPKDGQIEAKKTGAVNVGRYLPAILQQLSQTAKQYPTYVAAKYFTCGYALYDLGRYEEAITSYDRALELQPDTYEAHYNRGNALSIIGRYEEAIISYDRALKFKPAIHAAWSNRGFALMKVGQFEAAYESYDRAILLKSNDAGVHYNRACCYGLQNQVDLAITTLQQAITLDSECREWAKTDSDFDPIQQDDRFQALIGE